MSGQAEAGWYYAQGDPPGTLRYWNGAQWTGEPQYPPQPAVDHTAPFRPGPSGYEGWAPSPAPWSGGYGPTREKGGIGARLLAYLIDWLIALLPFLVLGAVDGDDGGALAGIGFLIMAGIFIWNIIFRQATTGQSVGKSAVNVTLLGKDDHRPIGAGKSIGRVLLGWLLNSIVPIDLLWALFDGQNQRLVDKILNTNVFKSEQVV